MLRRLLLIYVFVLCSRLCCGQVVELPDSIFSMPIHYEREFSTEGEMPHIEVPFDKPQFLTEEVSPLSHLMLDYNYSPQYFNYMPDAVSEHLLHVLLLHLSKIDIPGLEEHMLWYNTMLDNFSRNLYKGGGFTIPYQSPIFGDTRSSTFISAGGGFVVYSGTLDPVEAYRRWVQQQRLRRARDIVRTLEQLPASPQMNTVAPTVTLPDNLLKENNYDVKVKLDGDNPPYRPYGE